MFLHGNNNSRHMRLPGAFLYFSCFAISFIDFLLIFFFFNFLKNIMPKKYYLIKKRKEKKKIKICFLLFCTACRTGTKLVPITCMPPRIMP